LRFKHPNYPKCQLSLGSGGFCYAFLRCCMMFGYLWLLAACSPQSDNLAQRPVTSTFTIDVAPHYEQQTIKCDKRFVHKGQQWHIQQLAFFVSNMQYKMADSEEWQALSFVTSPWQTEHTALIWYATGCDSDVAQEAPDNKQGNTSLMLQSSEFEQAQAPVQMRFSLSVPFEYNHLNPLTQSSPLNNPSMFWSWRLGHKFLRLDINSKQMQKQWSFHLGSLGCQSQSSLRPPEQPCSQPNRFEITLNIDSQNQNSVLNFDLSALLENIDMARMSPCMFDLSEQASCALLLDNIQDKDIFSFAKRYHQPLIQVNKIEQALH